MAYGTPRRCLPDVAAEARRRRLTALINAASLARAEPAVYVIEDAHWIDESSESMLADFLSVVPQTPSLTLITYRPEYRGLLARVASAQNLALRPLSDAHASTLTTELLGDDPSTGSWPNSSEAVRPETLSSQRKSCETLVSVA